MGHILAIDPGCTQTAYVIMDDTDYIPLEFAKVNNEELRKALKRLIEPYCISKSAIEMVASYGMAVGREVFETCVWIGRFTEILTSLDISVEYIFRKDVKMHICGQTKAKDSNIRMALIDRFAKHDFKNGKGTKNNPDHFYGFSKDEWAAYGVGLTLLEKGGE